MEIKYSMIYYGKKENSKTNYFSIAALILHLQKRLQVRNKDKEGELSKKKQKYKIRKNKK